MRRSRRGHVHKWTRKKRTECACGVHRCAHMGNLMGYFSSGPRYFRCGDRGKRYVENGQVRWFCDFHNPKKAAARQVEWLLKRTRNVVRKVRQHEVGL